LSLPADLFVVVTQPTQKTPHTCDRKWQTTAVR